MFSDRPHKSHWLQRYRGGSHKRIAWTREYRRAIMIVHHGDATCGANPQEQDPFMSDIRTGAAARICRVRGSIPTRVHGLSPRWA